MADDKPTYTYFDRGVAEAAEEAGGRYGRLHSNTTVTGDAPSKLPAPQWCRDLAAVPDEPLIDARDCGDVFGMALGGASPGPENTGPADDAQPTPAPLMPDAEQDLNVGSKPEKG
jgi:hypothetical protein